MKVAEIRKLTTEQLTVESSKLRDEIAQMRREIVLGELSASRTIRGKRKDLARMLTVLTEQLSKEKI